VRRYLFVWSIGSGTVSEYLTMATIAWLVGTRKARHVRIWYVPGEPFLRELTPLINRQTHQVCLMDGDGVVVDMAEYPYVQCEHVGA